MTSRTDNPGGKRDKMLTSVDLSDYMLHNPVRVRADDDLYVAIRLITENRISGVCVVDEEDRLIGVLSELDCLEAIVSATYNQSGTVGTVGDFMTTEVEVCSLHTDVVDVASDMLRKGHRRRPVVQDGKLVGQITCRQILRVFESFNRR